MLPVKKQRTLQEDHDNVSSTSVHSVNFQFMPKPVLPAIISSQTSSETSSSIYSPGKEYSQSDSDISPSPQEKSAALLNFFKLQLESDNNTRTKKIQMLTMLPPSWTYASIQDSFPKISNDMIKSSKDLYKEKGILSSPNIRKGNCHF